MAASDADKSPGQLLDDIAIKQLLDDIDAAVRTANPTEALAPFGRLLAKLSRDANARSDTLLKVTNSLYWVTVALLVFTVVSAVIELLKFRN